MAMRSTQNDDDDDSEEARYKPTQISSMYAPTNIIAQSSQPVPPFKSYGGRTPYGNSQPSAAAVAANLREQINNDSTRNGYAQAFGSSAFENKHSAQFRGPIVKQQGHSDPRGTVPLSMPKSSEHHPERPSNRHVHMGQHQQNDENRMSYEF